MSFLNFPNDQYYRPFATGVVEKLGSFQLAQSMDLLYVQLTLLKRGAAAGSERMRVKIYPTIDYETVLYTSDWRNLTEIATVVPTYWTGTLRFDFATAKPINQNLTYHFAIETENYTRTGTFEIGAKLDWPDSVYTSPDNRRGAQVRFYGYRADPESAEEV